MKTIPKNYLKYLLIALILAIMVTGFLAYHGQYLGQEKSPNGMYTLKYYSSFNPFKMQWSMPGSSSCKPRWIRLYDKQGNKLKELFTTECEMEMPVRWLDKQAILPDGKTIWQLPGPAE